MDSLTELRLNLQVVDCVVSPVCSHGSSAGAQLLQSKRIFSTRYQMVQRNDQQKVLIYTA